MPETQIEDEVGTVDGLDRAEGQRPGVPAMLSHMAFMTRDTAATADFCTRVLGMELVVAVLDDAIPSTGEPVPYFHSSFRLGDGSGTRPARADIAHLVRFCLAGVGA